MSGASCDLLLLDVHAATMRAYGVPYGAVRDAAIAMRDGVVVFAGRSDAYIDVVCTQMIPAAAAAGLADAVGACCETIGNPHVGVIRTGRLARWGA